MSSISAYSAASCNANPVFGGSKVYSPPMFRGENLKQPEHDGFVSTQPQEEKSFYQRNKALVWVLGAAAAIGGGFLLHKKIGNLSKYSKNLEYNVESLKKMTNKVEKFDSEMLGEEAKKLVQEHHLKEGSHDLFFFDTKKVFQEGSRARKDLEEVNANYGYGYRDKKTKKVSLIKLYDVKDMDKKVLDDFGSSGIIQIVSSL